MESERYLLPFGWIKELDQATGQPFYVDTKANPPRSIWTHPYEDGEFLEAHPDVRGKFRTNSFGGSDSNLHLPSFEESQRRHSFGGPSTLGRPQAASRSATSSGNHEDRELFGDRGFFGTLKDMAIGTREEREAEQRRRQEEEAQRHQKHYAHQPQHGGGHGPHHQRPGNGTGTGIPLLGSLATGLLLSQAVNNGGGRLGGGRLGSGGFGGGNFGGF